MTDDKKNCPQSVNWQFFIFFFGLTCTTCQWRICLIFHHILVSHFADLYSGTWPVLVWLVFFFVVPHLLYPVYFKGFTFWYTPGASACFLCAHLVLFSPMCLQVPPFPHSVAGDWVHLFPLACQGKRARKPVRWDITSVSGLLGSVCAAWVGDVVCG